MTNRFIVPLAIMCFVSLVGSFWVIGVGYSVIHSYSNPPTPSAFSGGQVEQDQAAHPQSKSAMDGALSPSPPAGNPIGAKDQSPANSDPNKASGIWSNPDPNWVIAVFTIVLAGLAWAQWNTSKDQHKAMQDTLAANLVSAQAAKDSADLSKLALHRAERAYIHLDTFEIQPGAGGNPLGVNTIFKAVVKNYGRTTAKDVRGLIGFRTTPPDIKKSDALPILLPADASIGMPSKRLGDALDQPTIDNINSKTISLRIYVVIDYADVFDNRHTANTEAIYSGPREISIDTSYET